VFITHAHMDHHHGITGVFTLTQHLME
jgi:ribonuclease BN (tRNA processing enzyme)